jgi:hypothetical protein
MKKETKDEFITVDEAAAELGLKPKTVYNRKGGTGHLTRVRQGRTIRLIKREVLAHKSELIEKATRRHYVN